MEQDRRRNKKYNEVVAEMRAAISEEENSDKK